MLCVIGDLVEDIVVTPVSEVIDSADTDAVIRRRRGGAAANTAVAAAGLGCDVRLFARVGADSTGAALIASVERNGVDVVAQRAGHTGTIVVLVDSMGERSMIRDRGAAMDLDALEPPGLDGASWLHVSGYSLVDGAVADVSRTALGDAHARGIRTSVDVASVSIIRAVGPTRFREMLESLAPTAVFANRAEANALGFRDHTVGEAMIVVKQGPAPAWAREPDGEVVRVPAVPLDLVTDTTGAGDAFAAGFVVSMLDGGDVVSALAAGHAAAAAWIRDLAHPSIGSSGQVAASERMFDA